MLVKKLQKNSFSHPFELKLNTMKTLFYFFSFLLFSTTFCVGQNSLAISYNVSGNLNANALSPSQLVAAPKECIIDFHFSAPSVRVVMESPDGLINYVDRVFDLNVHANPDSTYVYGKPGAWTINLGQFTNVNEFRVKLVNANGLGQGPTVAQGTYP